MAKEDLVAEALIVAQQNLRNEEFNHPKSISVQIRSKMALTFRSHWQTFTVAFAKIRNCCSSLIGGTCLVLLIISLLALAFKPSQKFIHVVVIDTLLPTVHTIDSKFLSVALDSSIIAENFRNFNMTDPKLHNLMSALSPGYLRIGGTMADSLYFVPNGSIVFKTAIVKDIDGGECSYSGINCIHHIRPNFTMSGDEWLRLNKLASDSGLSVLFDLNCLIRHENGSWDSRNTEELIAFSHKHNISVNWELGNEPNSFRHVFNYEVNVSQLASDFIKLRGILNKYPLYKNSLLVGPDTTRPTPSNQKPAIYLQGFLQNVGNCINATTWHQYYLNGRTATYLDFLNPTVFNVLKYQINTVYEVVKAAQADNRPVWLGETGSAYGGGAPGYSDRFIATFIWLDKLGVAAQYGLDVVIRQSLFKGHYALIYDDLTPSPDWWLSAIYKRLVGTKVVPCHSVSSSLVRLYCHCAASGILSTIGPSVTVFGINMQSSEAKIRIEGNLPVTEYLVSQKVLAYILTTHLNLLSKIIMLNDEILSLLPNGEVPQFKPKMLDSQPYLIMPPYSSVFWVIPSPLLYYCP